MHIENWQFLFMYNPYFLWFISTAKLSYFGGDIFIITLSFHIFVPSFFSSFMFKNSASFEQGGANWKIATSLCMIRNCKINLNQNFIRYLVYNKWYHVMYHLLYMPLRSVKCLFMIALRFHNLSLAYYRKSLVKKQVL